MSKPKLIFFIVLAVLTVIIVYQNTSPINFELLLWTIPIPKALFFFVAVLLGFVAGVLATKSRLKRP